MRHIVPGLLIFFLTACAVVQPGQKPGFVVFFQERSADIDPAARATIAQAASAAIAAGKGVSVVGWTDSAGSVSADVVLSQQRAQHVADLLAADGVPPAQIVRRGRGQTGEDPGVASRRVDIDLGG